MIHEALCELTLMSQITRLARRVHSISGFGGASETEQNAADTLLGLAHPVTAGGGEFEAAVLVRFRPQRYLRPLPRSILFPR